jgi:3-hydroxyisobutyrate dehydrogenase-like beta-hydroxyacid dehydrogenase
MAAGVHLPASFTVDLALNNIRQAMDEAVRLDAQLPLLALAGQFYADIQRRGGGALDTSSLITMLE